MSILLQNNVDWKATNEEEDSVVDYTTLLQKNDDKQNEFKCTLSFYSQVYNRYDIY